MSTLQWALLLLGVGIAAVLIWSSRRERRALERETRVPAARVRAGEDWNPEPSRREPHAPGSTPTASDVPAGVGATAHKPPDPAPITNAAFDEFGVGKARTLQRGSGQARVAPEIGPGPGPGVPDANARIPGRSAPAAEKPAGKVIGLYIAEHEGTNIFGPKIHAALAAQGLRFGAKRVYHRLENDQPVFSVASLVKPGELDPAESEGFSTPGLSVFMALPGPSRPVPAFEDMLGTARALARALNAELYDTEQRLPLTAERERALHAQVEEWARRNAGGRAG